MGLSKLVDIHTRVYSCPCTNLIDEVFPLITKNVGGSPPRVTNKLIRLLTPSDKSFFLACVLGLANILDILLRTLQLRVLIRFIRFCILT